MESFLENAFFINWFVPLPMPKDILLFSVVLGLGKTSALLIPTLQAWQGTSFTIDISGDICRNIDKPHKMIYEPANPDSIPYNIFGAIDDLDDDR